MNRLESKSCPVCGERETRRVVDIDDVPVYCNVLYDNREEALSAPRGSLHLAFCPACGHVFNTAFQSELLDYTQQYENSLHYSPHFQRYAEQLATDLVRRHGLVDKTIVEIACGKGDFLRLLCSAGNNRGYGFDPSYEPPSPGATDSSRVSFVNEYYGPTHGEIEADLICCRHALEHIEAPTDFLRVIRESIRQRPGPVLFVEVPNSLYSFKDLGIWDLIYEHPSYFCRRSLVRAFELAGFRVTGVTDSFGAQFLCAEALPAWPGDTVSSTKLPGMEDLETLAGEFGDAVARKVGDWRKTAAEWKRCGRRVAVWGAGSKGVAFLNALRDSDAVQCAIDVNPKKHGKFIPGTGHRVMFPSDLADHRLDIVVAMNPNYHTEIAQKLATMNLNATLLQA